MSYPPPPPPQQQGKPRLRGRIPLRLGIIFLVLGVACLAVGIYVLATKSLSKVNDFQRVTVAARTGTVSFSSAGGYVAYYEASDVTSKTNSVPIIPVQLTSPSGKTTQLLTRYGHKANGTITKLNYDYGSHHGLALYEFHISETGRYQVQLTPNTQDGPGATIAFGKSIVAGTAWGAALSVIGVLLLLAGIPLLIVGLVKRSRSKNELAAYQYGGPPSGYGQPQPFPQQGYGPPPGPQQGYGPPPGPQQGYPPPGSK